MPASLSKNNNTDVNADGEGAATQPHFAYKVILQIINKETEIAAFNTRVTEAIKDGWSLHGAPTMCHSPSHSEIAQALTKRFD